MILSKYNQYSFLALPLTTNDKPKQVAHRDRRRRRTRGVRRPLAAAQHRQPAPHREEGSRRCGAARPPKESGQPHEFRLAVSFHSPRLRGASQKAICTQNDTPTQMSSSEAVCVPPRGHKYRAHPEIAHCRSPVTRCILSSRGRSHFWVAVARRGNKYFSVHSAAIGWSRPLRGFMRPSHSALDRAWYIARDGHQHGPITEIEFKRLIDLGHLLPTDLVWYTGLENWLEARSLSHEQLNGEPALVDGLDLVDPRGALTVLRNGATASVPSQSLRYRAFLFPTVMLTRPGRGGFIGGLRVFELEPTS